MLETAKNEAAEVLRGRFNLSLRKSSMEFSEAINNPEESTRKRRNSGIAGNFTELLVFFLKYSFIFKKKHFYRTSKSPNWVPLSPVMPIITTTALPFRASQSSTQKIFNSSHICP
jgi:hypothetical protein